MPNDEKITSPKDEAYFGAQLVLLYKDVIRHIGTLAADEADARRKITLERDTTAPYEEYRGDDGTSVSSSGGGVASRRLKLLDRRRAERNQIEEMEVDDRSLVVHEEFVEHVRMLKELKDEQDEIRRRRDVILNVARDFMDREATLGVLRLWAQWTLGFDEIRDQAALEKPAVARIAADRRLIEKEESQSRNALLAYRETLFSALLRKGYDERTAVTPIQEAFAAKITSEREARVAEALAAMKATKDAEDRLGVLQDEVEGRRIIRNLEQVGFGDITKMSIASTSKIIRGARHKLSLSVSASQAFAPLSPLSPTASRSVFF